MRRVLFGKVMHKGIFTLYYIWKKLMLAIVFFYI